MDKLNEEDTQIASFIDEKQIPALMYGLGDVEYPRLDTAQRLEEAVRNYFVFLATQAKYIAKISKNRHVTAEHFLFVIRHHQLQCNRAEYLLAVNQRSEEILKSIKQPEQSVIKQVRQEESDVSTAEVPGAAGVEVPGAASVGVPGAAGVGVPGAASVGAPGAAAVSNVSDGAMIMEFGAVYDPEFGENLVEALNYVAQSEQHANSNEGYADDEDEDDDDDDDDASSIDES